MPSPIGLFSRRKASADKALRAALAPQDPYIRSAPSSSAVYSLQRFETIPQPPHSAPLLVSKKKRLPRQQHPVASEYASDSVGVVVAPRLTRAKTSAFDDPHSSARGSASSRSRPSLSRSSSSGPSRRTKSFDQGPLMGGHQEMPPLDSRVHSQGLQRGFIVPPNSPMVVHRSPGATRNRVPVPTAVPNQTQRKIYPPVYPVSPPLSPESMDGSPVAEYGVTGQTGEYSRTERDMATDIAELEKAIYLRDNVIAKYAVNFDIDEVLEAPPARSEAQRVNKIISQHIKKLDTSNHGKENSVLKESSRPNNPKDHSKASSPEDLEKIQLLKRRELELVDAVKGKERELELLRSNSQGYREQIIVMERALARKDEELENARFKIQEVSYNQNLHRNTPTMEGCLETDIGGKLMDEVRRRENAEKKLAGTLIKSRLDLEMVLIGEEKKREEIRAAVWKEFEHTLQNEERNKDEVQQKSKENLKQVLGEEERRRAELNWVFGEKIKNIELLRRNDQEEYQKSLAGLKEDKARLEKQIRDNAEEFERNQQSARTQRDANEELLDMTKKINTRLGEEKRRNRHLEEKISQITEDALNNVSGANREVAMLKNVVEDKDTKIKFFETGLMAMKKEREGMEEAWTGLENELEEARKALLDRDEKVKGLEKENSEVADRLESYRKELDELKKKTSAGDQQITSPEFQDMAKIIELLKQDIELYKGDVRAYKKDVKKRDNHIKELQKGIFELESMLESKTLETKALQDALNALGYRESSPSSSDSSGTDSKPTSPLPDEIVILRAKLQMYEKEYRIIHEEHKALKKKHDLFISQQAMVIAGMDQQLIHARKEKDAVEATATKQLKRMQHGFLQLSQTVMAGRVAGPGGAAVIKKYQEVPLPPLPTRQKNSPISPKRSNTSLKRGVSKVKASRRHSSLSGLPPVPALEPVVRIDTVRVGKVELKEKTKLERAVSAVNKPDSAQGEEEVIEW